jgi:hypothetical protein
MAWRGRPHVRAGPAKRRRRWLITRIIGENVLHARWITRYRVFPIGNHLQADLFRLDPRQHPVQRYIRQTGVLISAADVGMHTRKPHLLYVLEIFMIRVLPQARLKGTTPFVHGKRVKRVLDIRAERHVVKLEAPAVPASEPLQRHAQRPDRIEDAKQADFDLRVGQLGQSFIVVRLSVVWGRAIKIPRACLVLCRAVLGFQQSARADIARHASRREGAARKAEYVDLDSFFVLLRQKPVSASDVVTKPRARRSANDLIPGRKSGPDAVVVINPLVLDPMRGFELWIDQIPYADDIGDLLAVVGVPRTIEAQNQTFECAHGIQPPSLTQFKSILAGGAIFA